MRRLWLVILAAALICGGYLRFSALGAREMSDDEGSSLAAAAAPAIAEVIALQKQLNPGKLAVHELLLHGWIAMFGQGLAALRALSAALGTIAIVLVFWVACELIAPPPEATASGGYPADDRREIAAIAALVFALNLVTIKYSREARMYPVMLAAMLAQAGFFVRASRRGGLVIYGGAAIFAILAVAANFTAALLPASEGLWLLYLISRSGFRPEAPESRRAWALLLALAAGGLAFLPILAPALAAAGAAVEHGAIGWIEPPPLWEPIALFNKATGSIAFPLLAAAAGVGAVRGWRRARDGVAFALVWMWAPPLLMMIASYAVRPIFVERYALSCFAPFFILGAIGIWSAGDIRARAIALAIVAAVSLGHVHSYNRKPHDAQWREAALLASANLRPGETMTAIPAYAIAVTRYYLPVPERDRARRATGESREAAVVLLRDHGVAPRIRDAIRIDYPVVLGHLRGVWVLRR
ncbi:MAG TPA: hypothetical protein VEC38_13555 [Candidatus Binataceae bacterium]|nr:hypothetical protein [Candidatus Binataceae bacterium]